MKKLLSLLLIALLCIVSVPATANAAIKINIKTATVIKGDYLYLKITGTKQKVTWTSSDNYKASVSSKGKVTTKGTGRVNITAKVGSKKYTCKVKIIPNLDPNYMTEQDLEAAIAEKDYIDNYSSEIQIVTTPQTPSPKEDTQSDTELDDKISNLIKTGFAGSEDFDTELGKAYLKFCETWISESELNAYGISVAWDWPDNEIYLLWDIDKKYVIGGAPDKFVSGSVYTDGNIEYQYLEKFEHNGEKIPVNQYYFNRADLVNILSQLIIEYNK